MRVAAALLVLSLLATSAGAEQVELVAGSGTGGSGSPAKEVKLGQVFGVQFDPAGNLFVIEYTNRLWKIEPGKIDVGGKILAVAGTGAKGGSGDGGPAADALLNVPHAIAIHRETGDIYIADTGNYKVRKVDGKTGVISTFAGTGQKGATGDGGPAKDATFGGIYCVAFDPACEKLIVTDLDNRQVRSIDMKSGVVSLVAGNGKKGAPADGAEAKTSPLVDPRAATADAKGNVFILERGGHALRVVNSSGKIRTIAGTGKAGAGGDGGPALQASLNGPKHLWIAADGNVLIADTENHVIRRVDLQAGTISRVAGTGKRGSAGVGGPPDQVQLSQPHGIYQSPDGTLYISDSMNGRVLKIVK